MARRICAQVLLTLLCAASSMAFAKDRPDAGDIPPDDLGKSVQGEPVRISDHAGKIVIVSFWASWCPPCRKEIPVLEQIQKAAGMENLRVFSINIESRENFRALRRALSKSAVTIINDPNNSISARYGVNGIPHMVIIGRDGKIASVHLGYDEKALPELVDEINALWRKGQSPPSS